MCKADFLVPTALPRCNALGQTTEKTVMLLLNHVNDKQFLTLLFDV